MTRQELKDQVQHDRYTDAVSGAIGYASSHRKILIRWAVIAIVIALIVGAVIWYLSYQRSIRRQALETALVTAQAPVGQTIPGGKSFPTEQAKDQASIKALSDVVTKYGGSHEGLIAQYYLGTVKASGNDKKGAESDLKKVADSGDKFASLAKIALSQLYAGENRMPEAQKMLRGIADKGSDLVSKAQAKILLAQLYQSTNPKEAKQILDSLKNDKDPAVTRAVTQMSGAPAR